MSDEAWRTHERRWRQEPSDQDALGRAIAGMRRSGLVVPPELLDARVEPATALETTLPLEVWAVLPGEREPTTVGWGPGRVEVPPHRYWGVGDVPAGLEGLGALGDELRSRGIPGLRVREFEPSRHAPDALPLIDHDALRALGPQPQLRWLELSHSWGQPSTPGGVVRALGCLALEVFRGGLLVGADEDPPGERLVGCEDLHHLRELVVSDQGLVVEDLRALAGLRQLDGLFLDDEELGVKHLERAGFAQRLRRLRVGRFDDRDAASLPAFPALSSLAFDCHSLSATAAAGLAGSTNLSELEVELRGGEAETDLDAVLGRLRTSRLNRLAIGGSGGHLGDRGLAAALSIEGLRALKLGSHQHGERAVAPSFLGLASLGLSCSDVCWRNLRDASSLRELELVGLTPDLWSALPELPELARLRLGHLGRGGGIRDVNLARLESLQLLGSFLPARIQAPLRSLSLTRLTAERSAELFDVARGSVERLEHLKVDTALSEGDLAQLQRLQSLRTLELAPFPDGAEVVDQVMRLVRALPGLRRLAVGRRDNERPMFHMTELPGLRSRLAKGAPWIAQVSSIDD